MYDILIGLFEAIFRHGWSLSTAGAIVFLLLKQKKLKKMLKKYLPFMFSDDSEVKIYIGNQLVIMKNLELIMKEMRIEPWAVNISEEEPQSSVKKQETCLPLSWGTFITARGAENYTKRRDYKMKKKILLDDESSLLDAGHGGKDPGAIGTTGTKEKDFTLIMVRKIEKRLKSDKKVNPVLTRNKDTFLELGERVSIANKKKVDIFISIHANSSGTGASGTETFYTREESKPLANIIHKHLVRATGLRDRKVKYGNLQVTRDTKMPAVLLEVGFINNKDDEKKLFDPAFQDRVADAIVAGIYEYFGIKPEKPKYKEMSVTVHTKPVGHFTGYNIQGTTWVPSRPIGVQLGGRIGYVDGKVTINGTTVETHNIDGIGYVTARDLTKLLGARIFWDKSNRNQVDIFIK